MHTQPYSVTPEIQSWLRGLNVDQIVVRHTSEGPFMQLRVTSVIEGLVTCGLWAFDQSTGGEIDSDLGWTAVSTGSFIRPDRRNYAVH